MLWFGGAALQGAVLDGGSVPLPFPALELSLESVAAVVGVSGTLCLWRSILPKPS